MAGMQRAHGRNQPDRGPEHIVLASPGSKGLGCVDDAHLVDGRQGTRWSGGEMRTGRGIELSHAMGIRQLVEQGLNRLIVSRMDPVRIEFSHRH